MTWDIGAAVFLFVLTTAYVVWRWEHRRPR